VGRFDPSQVIDALYRHYKIFSPEFMGVESVYYQKSLLHFLRLEMEKRGWMPVRELNTDSSVSKELRIRALEPYAMNLAIHCKKEHKDFIMEFAEYVPNNSMCTKDILDALAYQIQVARPGEATTPSTDVGRGEYEFKVSIDEVLEGIRGRHRLKTVFKEYALDGSEKIGDEFAVLGLDDRDFIEGEKDFL
jgi:hypothetical protein